VPCDNLQNQKEEQMKRILFAILSVMTITALTVVISSNAFAHPSRGNDCSQCHNSTSTPPSNTTPAKATGVSCSKTYQDTLKSCKFGVQDSYWLSIAKCDDLPSSETKACILQAKTNIKAGNEECKAQSAAQKTVCNDLGQGIYNPVINPSDFVNNIDNPLLPLIPGTTFIYEGITEKGNEHIASNSPDRFARPFCTSLFSVSKKEKIL
jgi:hypothetical protein